MFPNLPNETLVQFANDALQHLDEIRVILTHLSNEQTDESTGNVEQSRRLAHKIKGEASMIGLSGFSHVAFFLEECFRKIEDGETVDYDLAHQIVHSLKDFLSEASNESDDVDPRDYLSDGVRAYRRIQELPETGDDQEIQKLIFDDVQSVPAAETASDLAHLASFRDEAGDNLQIVSDILTRDRNIDQEDVQQIRRLLHSIKGGASTIGQHEIANLGHSMEDLLEHSAASQVGVTEVVSSLLYDGVDALTDLVDEGETTANIDELIRQVSLVLGQDEQVVVEPVKESKVVASQDAIDALQADLDHQISDDLMSVFSEEAEDHLKMLYDGLNHLKTDHKNQEKVQDVRRSAHTLKGAAGAVGMRVVTRLSHRMEDLLDAIYDEQIEITPEILTLLLNTTDRLHDLSFGEFDQEEVKTEIIQLFAEYAELLESSPENTAAPIPVSNEISVNAANVWNNIEPELNEEATGAKEKIEIRQSGQVLRVPLERIDDLVRTVSELIINRTTFEQRMTDFVQSVEELQPILSRLRVVSHDMETRHSIDALRGTSGGIAPGEKKSRFQEFDALEFDRYNEMHLIARTVSEATSDVNTVSNELRTLVGDFDTLLARQDRLSRDTQDRLMKIRMVPIATLATRLHRAVRVVATKQNKNVDLIVEGQEIELDKTVLEDIADPLLHLLRNAVDHGVEPSDLRVVKGKTTNATIRIRAFYQGTQVVVRISDDGAGLDVERICNAAVNSGLLTATEAESMTPQEIYPYIFVPGLSTASTVSEVSGRGVGMDIVRDKVQKLKGTISVESLPDKGTTFTIRLPMTLAVTRALMVGVGTEVFAIPMQSVNQILRLDRKEIAQLGADPVVRLGGSVCPLMKLADHIGIREIEDDSQAIPTLIIRSGDDQVAVRVDRIVAGRDIVVKTLGTHLRQVQGLVGATQLGDGTIVPILDPNAFSAQNEMDVPIQMPTLHQSSEGKKVMIVDDSVSVRRVMENLIKGQGWHSIVGKDGVDALEILQSSDLVPDIFLLDIEMPRMDGYELVSTLRSMERFAETPIVMVTSRAGNKHREKAFDVGATDYLVKPYQDEQLLSLVNKLTKKVESSLS
ncbi:Hpt domain-containing protein [bacterium]|jgi:chemosensory pili system protein ChpA (sensor histidine kinase/response regulator)|nr:Hpt domain-containing protein [bacterium]